MVETTRRNNASNPESWLPSPDAAYPGLSDLTRRIIEVGRSKLPKEEKLERIKQLRAELQSVHERGEARPKARTAILRAAHLVSEACGAAPDDLDLSVLHNVLELMLRATSGGEGNLFARFHEFVNSCDEEVPLGLIALRRTGATRGGGSDPALARKLAALVRRLMREGKGAFESQMQEGMGLARTKPVAAKATRYDVAICLAAFLRPRFNLKVPLTEAADLVYRQLPTNGNSRFHDAAGSFRDIPFSEDPEATVVAAFRGVGFAKTSSLFSKSRMAKSRRKKRIRAKL